MMEQQNITENNPVYPSLHHIKCTKCDKSDFTVIGTKGSKAKAYTVGVAFGAIANLVADSKSKKDASLQEISYKCKACGTKFTTLPLVAQADEILSTPCKITFTRKKSFVGMAVSQTLWMNGTKIAALKNGESVDFETHTRYNILYVTDQYGLAFKGNYKFEAQPDAYIRVDFKRKFKNQK